MTDTSIRIGNPFAPPRAEVSDIAPDFGAYVLASRWLRLAAALLDWAVFIVPALVLLLALAPQVFGHGVATALGAVFGLGGLAVLLLMGTLVLAVVQCVMVWRSGQSIGKRIVGLRVVRSSGERVSFARMLFLRWIGTGILINIPRWVLLVIGAHLTAVWVGFFCSLASLLLIFGPTRRCLHDFVADTCVATAASSPRATLASLRT
jgi:uncharacterized RDD family membrane protein YckC